MFAICSYIIYLVIALACRKNQCKLCGLKLWYFQKFVTRSEHNITCLGEHFLRTSSYLDPKTSTQKSHMGVRITKFLDLVGSHACNVS